MTEQKLGRICSTLQYCSPELHWQEESDRPEVEVWSLGVVLYCVITGSPLFAVEGVEPA